MTDPKKSKNFDGIQSAAEMMNVMEKSQRDKLLQSIAEREPEMAEMIRQRMFIFEDLVKFSGRSLQILLKEIPIEKWVIALRNATDEFKAVIFENLSERAAKLLQEELQLQKPQKLSKISSTQQEIVKTAQKMILEGKI